MDGFIMEVFRFIGLNVEIIIIIVLLLFCGIEIVDCF